MMNTDELVRSWKDPDSRIGELSFHPSGLMEFDPVGGAGHAPANTWSTISVITVTTTTTTGPSATTVTTISTMTTTKL